MAFPALQLIPSEQLPIARKTAGSIKVALERINAQSLAGDIPRTQLISLMGTLSLAISTLNTVASTPGIVQYTRDQFNNPALDVVSEFTAMVASITTLRDWIFTNFPKQSGAWLAQTFDNAGVATELTFSTAALVDYRTNAELVIATIG